MDAVFDAFAAVDVADILLKFVFLTVPGLAVAKGLERVRSAEPAPAQGGRLSRWTQGVLHRTASLATIAAVLAAGLGLIPLARAVFQLISGLHPTAPALIGITVLCVVLIKWRAVVKDLKDGRVDRPLLWLAPLPLAAVLFWVTPVIVDQVRDHGGDSVQMIVNGRDG